ncbi:hypothetical protein NPIL_232941 [Nephila pilipes]|uniref:Uncharacterized protein n=1 Tax=Nephila pilipes TaxID=299642 RepID=A0A8X6NKZ1_NEPPI|nr:hypothetical protein NPIL_232941 [Nephila pilipes]
MSGRRALSTPHGSSVILFSKINIPECDHRPFVEKGSLTQSFLEMIAKAQVLENLFKAWETFTGALFNLVVSSPENYVCM